jgi:chromosome partitioning protein
MIISAVNQKGGTGKTTVATNLAACFAAEGREVLLIDADPQRSALDWRADRPDDRPPVQTIGLPVRNLHREIEPFRRKYDVIIIDGGGRVNATARAAVMVADFVIIPTLPSKPDILSTQDFFKEVIEDVTTVRDVQGAVLLNQLQAGTVVSRKSEEYVKGLGYPVFKTMLHQYVAYREAIAAGLSVLEYDRTSKAAQELATFFDELKEVLA